ncbi:TetR/AcrR family transcriptional regulator [Pseudomonas vancouverensis]|uniref:TetR/AcrR family transcriptional regulator n=1 Tax=Pseudomonas vancouverensis TaxID=95300 RepID=A0A1H2NXB1_PSEVA|nr:TetR/AcrR family transcriptional regulator [Pseudomonas vancouverensis]KAB0496499.1 TetR/AcrR family transcriptional regulator [Pseudomonas vancouverensis]TDB64793.1 TetR/AcrR family transcriptional regulator [Pseudomonas vancouverensis]SDV10028.1 transcriptional regulator, TetR family [Pseudomonas vancouverensis]
MRKSRQETSETRQRIVEAASAEFRKSGISGTGLSGLMAAAGLTHGGFYRHFESKDQVLAEACDMAVDTLVAEFEEVTNVGGFNAAIGHYLSTDHRDALEKSCPYAALGSELVRSNEQVKEIATQGLERVIELLATQAGPGTAESGRARALIAMCTMMGALTLSRMAMDPALSSEILQTASHHLIQPGLPEA